MVMRITISRPTLMHYPKVVQSLYICMVISNILNTHEFQYPQETHAYDVSLFQEIFLKDISMSKTGNAT